MHSLRLSFTCQTAVNDRIISGNLDSPEGGLDGLVQAVVCEDVSTQSHCNTICKCTHASQHTHEYLFYNPLYSADHWMERQPCQASTGVHVRCRLALWSRWQSRLHGIYYSSRESEPT